VVLTLSKRGAILQEGALPTMTRTMISRYSPIRTVTLLEATLTKNKGREDGLGSQSLHSFARPENRPLVINRLRTLLLLQGVGGPAS
jgi:hypothetical protein